MSELHNYPAECERVARTRDGVAFLIRPIRPDDLEREFAFVRGLSSASLYNRIMYAVQEPTDALLRPLVNIDYRQHMALVALMNLDGVERFVGVARYAVEPQSGQHEFAVVVTDQWQGHGVGRLLLIDLFEYARRHGLRRLVGNVLSTNERMLAMARKLGMKVNPSTDDPGLITLSREFEP